MSCDQAGPTPDGSILSHCLLAFGFQCHDLQVDREDGKTPSGENLTPINFSESVYVPTMRPVQ